MMSFQVDEEMARQIDRASVDADKTRSAWLRDAVAAALQARREAPRTPEVMTVAVSVGETVQVVRPDSKKDRYLASRLRGRR